MRSRYSRGIGWPVYWHTLRRARMASQVSMAQSYRTAACRCPVGRKHPRPGTGGASGQPRSPAPPVLSHRSCGSARLGMRRTAHPRRSPATGRAWWRASPRGTSRAHVSDFGSRLGAASLRQLRSDAVRRRKRSRRNTPDVRECPRPGLLSACALSCGPGCRGFESPRSPH
jgi:hypothetical protein